MLRSLFIISVPLVKPNLALCRKRFALKYVSVAAKILRMIPLEIRNLRNLQIIVCYVLIIY